MPSVFSRLFTNDKERGLRMESVFDPEKQLTIKGRELTFRPLVYRQFSRFMTALPKMVEAIAKEKPDLDIASLEANPLEALSLVGDKFFDQGVEWLSWSLFDAEGKNVDLEWLKDNLGLADFADLARRFVVENDLRRTFENFRKLGTAIKGNGSPRPSSLPNSEESSRGPVPTTSSTG